MTADRNAILRELRAVEQYLASRVDIVRVVITPDGTPTGQRIYRGSFTAPADYVPPSFEKLLSIAKGRTHHD